MLLHATRWAATSGVLLLSVISPAGAFLPRVEVPVLSAASRPPVSRSLEPNHNAGRFSLENAYFLSEMSNLAYKERAEVERVLKGQLGYSHFSWFEFKSSVSDESFFDGVEDTEGFVAANDDVILLVFRGTSSLGDFATDFKINLTPAPSRWGVKGSLHKGFFQGVESVWQAKGVVDTLRKLYNEPGKDRRVFVTGHSLGAALATVATGYLAFEEKMNIHSLYTTGAPRVFDRKLAKAFNGHKNGEQNLRSKSFRTRNCNDVVTRVPFPFYRHIGKEIYFNRSGIMSTSSIVDRLLARLIGLLKGTFLDGIDDHEGGTYSMLLLNALEESRKSVAVRASEIVSKVTKQPKLAELTKVVGDVQGRTTPIFKNCFLWQHHDGRTS